MRWSWFRRNRHPMTVLAFSGAVICMCIFSTKFLLLIVALILIAIGIWLLKCS